MNEKYRKNRIKDIMKEKYPGKTKADISMYLQTPDIVVPAINLTPDRSKPVTSQIEPVLFCQCIYGEARGEDMEGMQLVAQCIMNRYYLDTWFGRSVRDVILKSDADKKYFQFECMSPVNPNFTKLNNPESVPWIRIVRHCLPYYFGVFKPEHPLITNYHADYIDTPSWTQNMEVYKKVGRHIFYLDFSYAGRI